jgi:hypothetical protein
MDRYMFIFKRDALLGSMISMPFNFVKNKKARSSLLTPHSSPRDFHRGTNLVHVCLSSSTFLKEKTTRFVRITKQVNRHEVHGMIQEPRTKMQLYTPFPR